jgi:H+/Cl- antiporter ClcA
MSYRKIKKKITAFNASVRGTFNNKVKVNLLSAIPFWIASLFTGLIAVAYTNLFNFSEGLLHQALHWQGWLIFVLAPLSFLLGWFIIKKFSPNAGGSGIPQVMAAIDLSAQKNEKAISKLLSLRIIVCKILSSLCMVLGGGAIGREGPTIQIAGSVFRIVNKCIPLSWPKLSQKSFILTGAAAGLAAAFNTPLGGIVFAIEELARIHISVFRTALFTAVIIAGLAAQSLLGPYLYLGYPDVRNLHPFIFLGVIAVAVMAGLLAGLMCKGILYIMKWRRSLNNAGSVLFVLGLGLFIASIAFFVNDNILGSGKDLMNARLFTDNKAESWHTMLLRIIGPMLSFNTGAAGGIFAPSLAAGASVGAFFSGLFDFMGANANVLILSGMVGFLTGVTRTPFTSAILVLEMTDRHSVIFHLMLAAMVASMASLLIDRRSLYDRLKKNYLQNAHAADKPAGSGPVNEGPVVRD